MKRIFLDLDGVMADFDAHFPATFGLSHRYLADDDMWRIINAHPTYFLDMPMCRGAREFFYDIVHLQPVILTACPKSAFENSARQKRAWVAMNLSPDLPVITTRGGAEKPSHMTQPGDILIDDYPRNTHAWAAAGGVAILHMAFEETRAALNEALTSWNASDAPRRDPGVP